MRAASRARSTARRRSTSASVERWRDSCCLRRTASAASYTGNAPSVRDIQPASLSCESRLDGEEIANHGGFVKGQRVDHTVYIAMRATRHYLSLDDAVAIVNSMTALKDVTF
jgi:hypothetical protein